ncbi:hypothetical protein [uncultured Sphaerochaeta sp.]|uniref:hypothetical protein n=1 Tax=uncultured Sphaerochaeta sp. TaxID=886478 RepID=UPI0029CA503C|nr:hypothetical protein [uncultured Sphaerochaeta sp.]
MLMTIKQLQDRAYGNALNHGFHKKNQNLGEMLCLIHSEISEALEADRNGRRANLEAYVSNGKSKEAFLEHVKDSVEDELADAVIRIADLCGYLNIDLQKHIEAKMNYNKDRGYLHGKLY